MINLEDLRGELRRARAKKSQEDHGLARENEAKAIKKELFLLKHRKKIKFLYSAKSTATHMGKNALAYGKIAATKLKEAEKKNKKKVVKKKRKNSSSPFGNFGF